MGTAATHAATVDWELLSRFREAVKQRYPDARILLFGSRARGHSHTGSDYDFIVVSPAFQGVSPLWRGQQLYRAWATLLPPVDVDLLCATPEEYEAARTRPTSWISEADREAVPI
ncbi:MAG: nucleotidyltransferase domain-containing protein [Chloroflexota bacterium]